MVSLAVVSWFLAAGATLSGLVSHWQCVVAKNAISRDAYTTATVGGALGFLALCTTWAALDFAASFSGNFAIAFLNLVFHQVCFRLRPKE